MSIAMAHLIIQNPVRKKLRCNGVCQETAIEGSKRVTEQELNRAIQYVTASTSYGRETVAEILRTGFAEMVALEAAGSREFERQTLLEYVCWWTIKRTGHPEPMVREVLGCAGRWLDDLYETLHPRPTSFV